MLNRKNNTVFVKTVLVTGTSESCKGRAGSLVRKEVVMEEARQWGTRPLPGPLVDRLFAIVNSADREDQKEALEYLDAHAEQIQPRSRRKLFPLLLHRLQKNYFMRLLVSLLTQLCSSETVTDSRIYFVANIYCKTASPRLADLLHTMRRTAGGSVYVPLTGQESPFDAELPTKSIRTLSSGNIRANAKVNTKISAELQNQKSDLGWAKVLASVVSAVVCSGTLPLAIEEFAYVYLRDIWNGTKTPTFVLLAYLLQWWPHTINGHAQLMRALSKADESASVTLVEQLAYYGPSSQPIVDVLAPIAARANPVVVLQYYHLLRLSPPPELVRFVIYTFPGGLPLCEPWAGHVPDVGLTIQGQFSLPQAEILCETVPEIQVRFAFPNCPWLGNSGKTMLAELGLPPIDLVDSENVSPDIDYEQFCMLLLTSLEERGIVLDNYFD